MALFPTASEVKTDLLKAGLTAGTFAVVDKMYYKTTDDKMLMRVAQVGGSQLVADMGESRVVEMVLKNQASMINLVNPVMCGGTYVAVNYFTGNDSKPLLMQFLHSTGSSFVANYSSDFVKEKIGL